MTLVLVNGNPETGAIWDLLVEQLRRDDTVRLSPPGFGAPIPDGFDCTATSYVAWLIGELEKLDGPVDLVGHDIGGSTVLAVAMGRPDLLRTWVSDSLGVFDPEYTWHDLAQIWQTPERGEESVAVLMGGTVEERVERMLALGIDPSIAEQIAPEQGPEMGRAILSFYRSAQRPVLAQVAEYLPAAAARPGLAIVGTDDHFVGSVEMRERSAARAGAQVEILEDVGHWWMVEAAANAARALEAFWAATTLSDAP